MITFPPPGPSLSSLFLPSGGELVLTYSCLFNAPVDLLGATDFLPLPRSYFFLMRGFLPSSLDTTRFNSFPLPGPRLSSASIACHPVSPVTCLVRCFFFEPGLLQSGFIYQLFLVPACFKQPPRRAPSLTGYSSPNAHLRSFPHTSVPRIYSSDCAW